MTRDDQLDVYRRILSQPDTCPDDARRGVVVVYATPAGERTQREQDLIRQAATYAVAKARGEV